MISELYSRLKVIADTEFVEIVQDSEIIFTNSGRAQKLRVRLVDGTFVDIWYSLEGEYSFHWEQKPQRNMMLRHDNAPHSKWSYVKTFPKHCHDGIQENITESHLSNEPETALREFLAIVRKSIITMLRKKK